MTSERTCTYWHSTQFTIIVTLCLRSSPQSSTFFHNLSLWYFTGFAITFFGKAYACMVCLLFDEECILWCFTLFGSVSHWRTAVAGDFNFNQLTFTSPTTMFSGVDTTAVPLDYYGAGIGCACLYYKFNTKKNLVMRMRVTWLSDYCVVTCSPKHIYMQSDNLQ